jgi:uncharacterized protein (DUF2147 family)
MKNSMVKVFAGAVMLLSSPSWADDLVGTWQQIDDKTGSPKALIEISKKDNDTYTGKIVKITPRIGYIPQEKCVKCPAPYKDAPILGLEIFSGLKETKENVYANGKVLDPLTGGIYNMKGKLAANKKRLHLRGYMGISAIGRTQIWIRQEP